jgi:anti-sigma regulatory factor (Ser/Thr protein kinase)
MATAEARRAEIEAFVLSEVEKHPGDIAKVTAEHFQVSRQAVNKHLSRLVAEGKLIAEGSTKSRIYAPKLLVDEKFELPVSKSLEEHWVWKERVEPRLKGLSKNVVDICHYGFTEMLNNVIDHSGSEMVGVELQRSSTQINIRIFDLGVGIFRKLVDTLGLADEQQAALELSKGKLTTDPKNHSGEGIFFSSRAFDQFTLLSRGLSVNVIDGQTWLLDEKLFPAFGKVDKGTAVGMVIRPNSTRTLESVFDQFSNKDDDYRFTRTNVPVALARVGDENLVSRSQAKRLLARLDRFEDVVLDFNGVESVGQAFADEIFRVFAGDYPGVKLSAINTSAAVDRMIRRARAHAAEDRRGGEAPS